MSIICVLFLKFDRVESNKKLSVKQKNFYQYIWFINNWFLSCSNYSELQIMLLVTSLIINLIDLFYDRIWQQSWYANKVNFSFPLLQELHAIFNLLWLFLKFVKVWNSHCYLKLAQLKMHNSCVFMTFSHHEKSL